MTGWLVALAAFGALVALLLVVEHWLHTQIQMLDARCATATSPTRRTAAVPKGMGRDMGVQVNEARPANPRGLALVLRF